MCCRSVCVPAECGSVLGAVVLWRPAGRRRDGQDLLSGQRWHGRLSAAQPGVVPVSDPHTRLCTGALRQHRCDKPPIKMNLSGLKTLLAYNIHLNNMQLSV